MRHAVIDSAPCRSERSTLEIADEQPEVSVVLPCLNEAETLGQCVAEARRALDEHFLRGEVIVADNGSTDGSQAIAEALGARVVAVAHKGYGNALRGGIAASLGEFVIFGDADDSYDFGDIPQFVAQLRNGNQLVMGNRFRGGILPGAMPWLHRYLGNPVLTGIGRVLFGCPVRDFHCGLRGFRRATYNGLQMHTTGMEFASEMVIQATLHGWKIAEIPTVLHPDGRSRPPHLRTWRDGWRHLRFMLLCCPRWLFAIPGTLLCALAIVIGILSGCGLNMPGQAVVAGILLVVGEQLLVYAFVAKRILVGESLHPASPWEQRLSHWLSLERVLAAGVVLSGAGGVWLLALISRGMLMHAAPSIEQCLPAGLLIGVGVQTAFAAWMIGLIGMFGHKSNPSGTQSRQ